jgi:acyl-CoA thioester hydrolase
MDFNGHMRNTAYLDTAGDVRMMFFESRGFSMREFERLRLGPVVTRDELDYRREFRLLEQMDVTLELAGISDDGSRFRLRNVFVRPDGKVAAIVTTEGGWFSLESRRLTVPPEPLLEAIRSLCRTDDFQVMPSGVRG